jgi:hypothetical protein
MIGFQLGFGWHFLIIYVLAMASTAIAAILGSSASDLKVAVEMLPMTFVPQIMFAGFFVSPDLIPAWLRWIQKITPLAYGLRLHMAYEYGGDCGNEVANEICDNVMASNDVDPNDTGKYWGALVGLFVCFRMTALAVLRMKASTFH